MTEPVEQRLPRRTLTESDVRALTHPLRLRLLELLSEGASTASEAACLGVPTLYLNPSQLGYLRDQERRYGLVYNTTDPDAAMRRALFLLDAPFDTQKQEAARRQLVEIRP